MARAGDPAVEAAGRFLDSFKKHAKLVIAVSGGSDSTGLLVALATLRASGRYPGLSLLACTVDHGLRPESALEAASVGELCARYGIPHLVRRWDGPKPATGLQAAAREKRYDLLAAAAASIGADAVLTAHTLDDQRETVAMRAMRADAGVGLAGMADAVLLDGRIWLLRPFLAVTREEIRDFLAGRGETWIDDPSNANRRFERVRLRERALHDTARFDAGRRLALSERAAAFLQAHACADAPCLFRIGAEGVAAALAEDGAWRGLAMLAAVAGGRVHAMDAASAARLRAFLASGTLSRLTAGRVVFDRRREGLYLYRECRGIAPLVLRPGEAAVWDGRFRIANRSGRALLVLSGDDTAEGEGRDASRGVVRRAHRAAPHAVFEDGTAAGNEAMTVEPIVTPYARFLPRFDLPLADALASLLGRPPFPSPPNE